ncbi:hypothetical protein QBB33_07935 [Streptomyces scabiei]|uniref:hypothetical protein n=1 Tax=Streptomyces scabiei TaxID=1930 RepID=UPI001FF0BABD|nr:MULTISPECIES: hypothetical protein [Streptomyces]MDX3034920.1 hypothetical protein [Streptomyces scabiei]MDX3213430.1 hypothetical protein [Streptomyces scabiei]
MSVVGSWPLGAATTLAELARDPHPRLALLRAREPVSWLPESGGWPVTRRDLALRVMRDAETLAGASLTRVAGALRRPSRPR